MSNLKRRYTQEVLSKVLIEGTTLDRIWAWYVFGEDKVMLSDAEMNIKQRLNETFTLLCNYHSPEQARPIVCQKFNISDAQFYRDVRNAKRLFGEVTETSKEADRYILSELAMRTFQLAAKNHDTAEMNKAIANIIKIKGLDKEDPQELTEEDLQSHNYYMVISVDGNPIKLDLNQIDNLPAVNRKKLSDILGGEITDVEAEVIMNK